MSYYGSQQALYNTKIVYCIQSMKSKDIDWTWKVYILHIIQGVSKKVKCSYLGEILLKLVFIGGYLWNLHCLRFFQVTLNERVLTLLPLKLFRLLRGFLWPLLLTPGKVIRLCTSSKECYVTNYEAEHKLHLQWNKCNNENTMCKTV